MARRNMSICVCRRNRNRQQEVCVERCRQEGKYRYLEPEPLAHWELPPELPPFREAVEQARKTSSSAYGIVKTSTGMRLS